MKWLLFTSLFPTQISPDNGLFNLARVNAIKQAGHDVSVISPNDLTPHLRYILRNLSNTEIRKHWLNRFSLPLKEIYENVTVYHPRWYSPPRSVYWKSEYQWLHHYCGNAIERIITKEKPDIILCSWLSPFGTYSKYLKEKFNIPVFLIPEGDDLLIYPERYKGWKQVQDILNMYCDRIICTSQYMYDKASKQRGLQNVVKIYNGYDHTKFTYTEKKQNPKGKIRLICVGYLDYVKGQDILIRVMSKLDERFELTLVGDGTLRSQLEKMVHDLGLEKRVHFTGFQAPDKLAAFYQNADIFCLASRSEGFGISILEAMACGLPVVASNVGAIPEKIMEGKNGFIAMNENIEDFVMKIQEAANTNWDHTWISEEVQDNYSWERWANEMMLQFDEAKKEMKHEL